MRTAVKFTCVGIVALLAGCSTLSSLNPFSKKAEPRNPPAALTDFKPGMTVRTAWTTTVGKAGDYSFAPALSGDSLFAAAADGTLMRIEASSGRPVWKINAGVPLTAGVGSDGNTVVVAGEKGVLLAFDANGKQRWKVQASSEVLSAPAIGQGVVIVRSMDNRIAAYDADSGTRRWVAQRSVPALTLRSAPGILIGPGTAFVGLPGGRLAALALSNGGPRWEVAVGDPRGTTELERIVDISGAPVIAGRDVCTVAYRGRIACFDAASGSAHWAKELSSDVGLGVDERFIFASDENGAVTAFARESGSGVWRNSKLSNRGLTTPLSFGRAVAVGDYQGYIHFLSREDGAFLARAATDGSAVIAASPVVAGAHAIFQTKAGTVVALATE
jgi:outer membrane protein assembly factor BamB